MINAKHLATFVLGAAAGVALNKYLQTEEGEKALADLKIKASQLKDDAEQAVDKAPEYFEKLKTEGAAALKENFPGIEAFLNDLLGKNTPSATVADEPKA
ncbi:YtxH domain-containing protein [Emticicia sp. SJ17W-69]|uniref:YtxH domain-containing protein n=1 Tax=Emticicia sp. SJ17W-69 TaxID=3421657 RepID=UPI003EBD66FC